MCRPKKTDFPIPSPTGNVAQVGIEPSSGFGAGSDKINRGQLSCLVQLDQLPKTSSLGRRPSSGTMATMALFISARS
jgi:hypothetical protein